jgi:hypothetical protein
VEQFALFGTHWCDALHCYFLVWLSIYGFFCFRVSMSGPAKSQIDVIVRTVIHRSKDTEIFIKLFSAEEKNVNVYKLAKNFRYHGRSKLTRGG